MNIGAISYFVSALTFFIFFIILLTDKHKGGTKRALLIATAVSCLWSLILVYKVLAGIIDISPDIFEYIKSASWLFLLQRLLSVAYNERYAKQKLQALQTAFYIFLLVLFLAVLFKPYLINILFIKKIDYLTSIFLLLSVVSIVLVEQVYRNTRVEQRWAIKYLCLGLLSMSIFDFYMYSNGLLYQRINPVLWQTRGFLYALVVPLIGFSVSRDPIWSPEIFISRRVVFHTTTLLTSGIYLMVMGFAGYYVRDFGGKWGLVAQAIFLFATILILVLFVTSRRIRARLYVLLNKHFYPYKYDYREEWLRFIRTISTTNDDISIYHQTIKSIAQIIESPGGMLWLRQSNGFFHCIETWQMPKINIREPAGSPLAKFMEENEFVISVDEFRQTPEVYNRLGYFKLPDWVKELHPWLIVPLINNELLIGFIILKHSPARQKTFNWEDSDLLKTAARQVATFLEQMNASKALAEARQFESFNKVSTYVVHDIKNLITQLTLISSNAERHKDNPLFMQDMLKTISNSVTKMNKMMQLLDGKTQTNILREIDIIDVLEELVHQREISGGKPVPILICESHTYTVKADKNQLLSIFGHLVQNAQDATANNGKITVTQKENASSVSIEIEDNGSGMDEDFIKSQLFKPFKTTKGSKGMGIGVYESREIIFALGGDIEVFSQPDRGTCFKLTIPAA